MDMGNKIVVIVRSRDEKDNIERFCGRYDWVDAILIADGGSIDDTVKLACQFPNVRIRPFLERTKMNNDLWRNPAGEHINFLIEWAEELNATWVIFDDMDCVPNSHLYEDLPEFIEDVEEDAIYVTRLYLYGTDKYYQDMSKTKEGWAKSLYAWRLDTELRFKTNPINHTHEMVNGAVINNKLLLDEPYFLLHYSWITEEEIQKKIDFYRTSGQHPTIRHPREFAGGLRDLPEWML